MNKVKLFLLVSFGFFSIHTFGGNPDRAGQASATQLLVNGWARSSGLGWSAQSHIKGIESMYMNIAGLAATPKTDFIFSRTNWLSGSGVNVSNFGFAHNMGNDNVLGLAITSIDFGDIPRTTDEQPDGGLGTYSPRFTNLGIGFGRIFTARITGGVLLRVFSENASNVKLQGVAFDAGIQYKTTWTTKDDAHFGVSIKNIGPDVKFAGDGIAAKMINPINDQEVTVIQRAAKFNIPALVNIGGAYDIVLDKTKETKFNMLTAAANFTYFAFSLNQVTVSAEYNYKKMFMIRGGFAYEKNIFDSKARRNVQTGPMGGITFELPFGKSGNQFSLDYSYRHSNPFNGSHAIGVKMSLGGASE